MNTDAKYNCRNYIDENFNESENVCIHRTLASHYSATEIRKCLV